LPKKKLRDCDNLEVLGNLHHDGASVISCGVCPRDLSGGNSPCGRFGGPSNMQPWTPPQGGSLRLLPPPQILLHSRAITVDVDCTLGGPDLRRIPRLFLGWSTYGDPHGTMHFGWWDLQGRGADQARPPKRRRRLMSSSPTRTATGTTDAVVATSDCAPFVCVARLL